MVPGEVVMDAIDPVTAVLTRDWSALGGWSLFLGLVVLIVVGAFREWWVPGARYRRTEALLEKSLETTQVQARQVDRLTVASELVGNLLSEATPHKGTLGNRPKVPTS
jgi:hypothetical protein